MTTKAIVVLLVTFLALSSVHLADAQQPKKVSRIGFLGAASATSQASRLDAFRQGLRDLGYVEGKSIIIEYRDAEGKFERLPKLAAELVGLKVDIIVTQGSPAAEAAKKTTSTIPIVMATGGDAVGSGLVASLARPGGNITGLSTLATDLAAKRLELLKEVVPKASLVAILLNPANATNPLQLKEIKAVAPALGVILLSVEVKGADDLETAFTAIRKDRAGGIIVYPTRCSVLTEDGSQSSRLRAGCRQFTQGRNLWMSAV
jgi:putative ABC transport system substrate-binding protein